MKVPTWVLSCWDEPAAVFTGMISNSLDFPGFGIKDGPNAIWDDSGYNDSTPRVRPMVHHSRLERGYLLNCCTSAGRDSFLLGSEPVRTH